MWCPLADMCFCWQHSITSCILLPVFCQAVMVLWWCVGGTADLTQFRRPLFILAIIVPFLAQV